MRSIDVSPEKVVDGTNSMGETPIWSSEHGGLYWTNVVNPPTLQFWNAGSGEVKTWSFAQRLGGFAIVDRDRLVMALADGLYDFTPSNGDLRKRVANPLEHAALHELRCDSRGGLWVGSIDDRVSPSNLRPSGGSLFAVRGSQLLPVLDGVSCSNGLAFGASGQLYHTDAPSRQIDRWDVDAESGQLSNRTVFATLSADDGFCDGATVDSAGCYWATLVFNGRLRRYRPDGTPDLELVLPFSMPTNMAFGGSDLSDIFITTSRQSHGLPVRGEGMLGSLYRIRSEFSGVPEPRVRD